MTDHAPHDVRTTWRRSLALVTALVALAMTWTVLTPTSAQAVTAPPTSHSWYVSRYDTTWAYNQGHALGAADLAAAGTQRHIAVLEFGATYLSGSTWYVTAFSGTDFPLTKARTMAEEFAKGYWVGTGSDVTSSLYVAIGTNNSAGTVTSAAGAALARVARTGWATADTNGWTQAHTIGANDFEAWGHTSSGAAAARSWISGYNSTEGRVFLVNIGSADGCPTTSIPTPSSCNAGLTAETIWKVSYSGAAYPLPEIYTTSGSQAKQWKYLSLYSVTTHGKKLTFQGVLTQNGACGTTCPGTDNTPAAGWKQLYDTLHSDSRTASTPGGPTDLDWQ